MKEKLEKIIDEIESRLNNSQDWTQRQIEKGNSERAKLGTHYENGLLDALKILDKHMNDIIVAEAVSKALKDD